MFVIIAAATAVSSPFNLIVTFFFSKCLKGWIGVAIDSV